MNRQARQDDSDKINANVFRETERVFALERRLTAIQSTLKEYMDKRSRILKYPIIFGDGKQIARERRLALEKIQLIMKEDWDG